MIYEASQTESPLPLTYPQDGNKQTLIHHYASISKAHTTIADKHTHRRERKCTIPSYITPKKWLANYLSGRQAYVHYSGKSSKTLNIPNGVPQGSVLSPTLFNLYMHDIPQPSENMHIASYADDITITFTVM
ncbi:Reverse transcriptase domain [Trinorchestia longiramus]|nr:Reverse transcriptase domain [Trinorchestia longiramus]